jgi:hypothetical protein
MYLACSSSGPSVNSIVTFGAAIRALAKRRVMQQQARYQRGSLSLEKRATGPNIWTFRYYVEGTNGARIYRKQPIGDVQKLSKRKDAEKAVIQLRININNCANFVPRTMTELVAHYQNREFANLAFSTTEIYKSYFSRYILPKYGERQIFSLKTVEIEDWLRGPQAHERPTSRAGHQVQNSQPHVHALFPRQASPVDR